MENFWTIQSVMFLDYSIRKEKKKDECLCSVSESMSYISETLFQKIHSRKHSIYSKKFILKKKNLF